ncbi:hypothetical protein AB205_0002170, partial [Aquarana catesbeiana]
LPYGKRRGQKKKKTESESLCFQGLQEETMFVPFLLLLFLQQKGHALQLTAPSSLQAIMGEDVTIPCSFTVNNPPINWKFLAITWYFQGKKILHVQNAKVIATDPRVSYTGRAEDGIADLSISNITIMDGGIYKCSILYTPKREEKEIRLDIQATPQINITDRVVVPNKESFLHSLISGFYPVDIDIKWLRDGDILDNVDMEKPQRDLDGTYSVRSSVTITPTKDDRERIFSCRVQHESLTAPLQEDFQLVYGDIPSVHITSQAFKLNVVQELVCSVSGFYPESITVYWFLNDTLLENAKTRRINSSAMESVYPFTPTEQNWGMELRCVVDHVTLTIPHVERLLVQVTDLKAQYKHTIVIFSVMLVGISGALTIVRFLIKQRKKPGRVEPQHAEVMKEWITKPSSSSSSSVTQVKRSLAANAAAKAAYSIASMAPVTPSLAPPSCPEEFPELFDQSVRYMLQGEVQHFESSDDGTQVEDKDSNISPERGVPKKDKKLAVMFPQLQHTARFIQWRGGRG